MANELPEVVPQVQSMPTTGWFCQTSGNARRRITKNTGSSENGIYDVAGIPGHSHNASAVISVDADYSRYRQTALSVLLQQPLHLFPVPGTGHLDGGVQRHCSIS